MQQDCQVTETKNLASVWNSVHLVGIHSLQHTCRHKHSLPFILQLPECVRKNARTCTRDRATNYMNFECISTFPLSRCNWSPKCPIHLFFYIKFHPVHPCVQPTFFISSITQSNQDSFIPLKCTPHWLQHLNYLIQYAGADSHISCQILSAANPSKIRNRHTSVSRKHSDIWMQLVKWGSANGCKRLHI